MSNIYGLPGGQAAFAKPIAGVYAITPKEDVTAPGAATPQALTWTTVATASDDSEIDATDAWKIKIKTDGVYVISYSCKIEGMADATFSDTIIAINAPAINSLTSTYREARNYDTAGLTGVRWVNGTVVKTLNANDYVSLHVTHDNSTDIGYSGGPILQRTSISVGRVQ